MKKIILLFMMLILVANLTAFSGNAASLDSSVTTIASERVETKTTHDDPGDYVWDSSTVTSIVLNGNSITVNGNGVTVAGSKATITSAGTYSISGTLADGQIIVNTKDKEVVRLLLNGVDIRNSTSAPIYVRSAEKTLIVLEDNTKNSVADGKSYTFEIPGEEEPNAAIFSKSDLTLSGNGSLVVNANFNDGIASKDGLLIKSGTFTITAADDGIRGKDYLVIESGNITVNALGDGLKSDNEEDAAKGYVSIKNGVIQITAKGDAITAQTDALITDGKITLFAGSGNNSRKDENISTKGIKGVAKVIIDGGTFTIDSTDDAIHSNGNITINGGTFAISTGDDGIHADATLLINGGDIRITKSYEGIESAVITINGGNIHIVSSDDGLNVAGGNDGSGMMPPGGGGRQRPGMPPPGQGQETFNYTGTYYLYINGGYIYIEAAGDGVDVNGAVEMTNGVLVVNGPTERMNSALDYDAFFKMNGGFVVAAGSSGMSQTPGEASSQNSILLNFTTQKACTLFRLQNSQGEEILTFAPAKDYQSIAFSSPKLVKGATYDVYFGGSSTGTVKDGLYQNGSYTVGTKYTSFTITSIVTKIGSAMR